MVGSDIVLFWSIRIAIVDRVVDRSHCRIQTAKGERFFGYIVHNGPRFTSRLTCLHCCFLWGWRSGLGMVCAVGVIHP